MSMKDKWNFVVRKNLNRLKGLEKIRKIKEIYMCKIGWKAIERIFIMMNNNNDGYCYQYCQNQSQLYDEDYHSTNNCNNPTNYLTLTSSQPPKSLSHPHHPPTPTLYYSHQPQISQLPQIQVSSQIRLLTLFFHKWCKYISYQKSIQNLRLKQIDNLRKSLTFNLYAVKFSYFHNWRKISKRQKQNREKFEVIKERSLIKKKKELFKEINGQLDIMKIEGKLKEKVNECLNNQRKKIFFVRFKDNQIMQKKKLITEDSYPITIKHKSYKPFKLSQTFLHYLTSTTSLPLIKSKTLTLNTKFSTKLNQFCSMKICFQQILKQVYMKKQIIQKVKQIRKNMNLTKIYEEFKERKNFEENVEKMMNEMRQVKIKSLVRGLKENREMKRWFQCDGLGEKEIINNTDLAQSLVYQTLIEHNINHKNEFLFDQLQYQHSKKKLNKKLLYNSIKSTFQKLSSQLDTKQTLHQKSQKAQLILQQNFFSSLYLHHSFLLNLKQNYNHYLSIHSQKILKQSFLHIKQYKNVKLTFTQTLQNIQQQIINKKQLFNAFQRIYERAQKTKATERVFNEISHILVRNIFYKCFSTQINIIKSVSNKIKENKQRQLYLLFDMLKQNKDNINKNIQLIKKNIIIKYIKERFINNINNNLNEIKRQRQLQDRSLKIWKQKFIVKIRQNNTANNEQTKKQNKVAKIVGVCFVKQRYIEYKNINYELNEKYMKLQEFLCTSQFNKFKLNLQDNFISNQKLKQKITHIQKNRFQSTLNLISQNSQYIKRHSKPILLQKTCQIQKIIHKQSFMNKFMHETKKSYLKRWIQWNQKVLVLDILKDEEEMNKNVKQMQFNVKKSKLRNSLKLIKSNHEEQKQNLVQRSNVLSSFLSYNRKKILPNLITKFHLVSSAFLLQSELSHQIKLKYFSKFMRNCLVLKYQKVQQFCSIKNYAKNLKHKTFKGLRMMLMVVRDKQNRLKTQQQIIIKVDKALHHSRQSNKLSETIQRYNMRQTHQINIPR